MVNFGRLGERHRIQSVFPVATLGFTTSVGNLSTFAVVSETAHDGFEDCKVR